MTENDKKVFADVMKGTAEMYSKQASKVMMSMYFNALQHLTIEQVLHGFTEHIRDTKHGSYMPKPADIIRHAPQQQVLENKGSLSWCDNTQALLDRYGPGGTFEREQQHADVQG